jgi:hypothetical protein
MGLDGPVMTKSSFIRSNKHEIPMDIGGWIKLSQVIHGSLS